MKIEHMAFNVSDPLEMGRWYVEHLGLVVKRRMVEPPYAHFLADDSGTVMIEIYGNTDAPIPDYKTIDSRALHLAFVSIDLDADIKRLTAARATLDGEPFSTPEGDKLAMLRDPWGLAVQLVQRGPSLI